MKNTNFFFIFFFLSCLLIYFRLEIIFGSDIRAPFTDDFYYYLTTAKNFINYGIISFDRISLTNGFQPLWFFYILVIKFITYDDVIFNSIIIISIFLLSFFSYFNFKRYFLDEKYNEGECHLISSLICFLTLFFSKNGMEIALAVYLFSLSLTYYKKNLLIFCAIGFLTFLSRLEFLIFYFIFLANDLFVNSKLFNTKYLIKVSFFPFLILIYLIVNYFIFGYPLPESGIAKSLFKEIMFNKETFLFLNAESFGMRFISILFIFNSIGLLFLFTKNLKIFTKIILITTFLFFVSNSLRSPWPLWTWHFFFLSISTPILLNDILKIIKFRYLNIVTNFIGIFFVIAYSYLFLVNFNIKNDHILNLAKKIENYYGNSQYEVFAMGDMAGKISYLLDKKLIQLEGLVGGNKVINQIKKENDLCKLFKEYNVDIYFTSKIKKKINDVYFVEEPSQVSENIKKMRGQLNGEPIKIFKSADLYIYAFDLKKNKLCNTNLK